MDENPNRLTAGEVTAHLLQRAEWSASRSSGPGGQRRDKVSTRAELLVTAAALEGLPDAIGSILRNRLPIDAALRIVVQDERSLARNQEIAAERLGAMVDAALAPPPPPRRPTRPSRASGERRLQAKVQRGEVKRLRGRPDTSA